MIEEVLEVFGNSKPVIDVLSCLKIVSILFTCFGCFISLLD